VSLQKKNDTGLDFVTGIFARARLFAPRSQGLTFKGLTFKSEAPAGFSRMSG
jgi:hypothetical protein